jgi:glycosyltransferase involved in cell wall biosynthesis
VPVIASVYTGSKEAVVDGATGYFVNPFDIDDFADKVSNILYNDKLHHSMSNQSKKEFKQTFTLEKCVNQYLDLLI